MVAAVAFVIGIGIGHEWGPFSSRHGKQIQTPLAHEVDVGRPAMASSETETMTPTPRDAPDAPPGGVPPTPPTDSFDPFGSPD